MFPRDTNEKSIVGAVVSPIPEAAAEKIKKVFRISEKEASKESWLSYLGQMGADLFWNYKYEIIGFFLMYISMRVLLSVVKKQRKKVLENHKRSDKKHYEEFKKHRKNTQVSQDDLTLFMNKKKSEGVLGLLQDQGQSNAPDLF